MKFLRTSPTFPISAAVIHSGHTFEAVLTGIPPGGAAPVEGGVFAELKEIFRQLDELLAQAGIDRTAIASVRLYLADVLGDIDAVNKAYAEYFGSHPPNRRAYGVVLQRGMKIEAAFVAEIPPSA